MTTAAKKKQGAPASRGAAARKAIDAAAASVEGDGIAADLAQDVEEPATTTADVGPLGGEVEVVTKKAKAPKPDAGVAATAADLAAGPEVAAAVYADLVKYLEGTAGLGEVKAHDGGLYTRVMDGKRTFGYVVKRRKGTVVFPGVLAASMPAGVSYAKVELGSHHYGRGEVVMEVIGKGDFPDVAKALKAAKANPVPKAPKA